MSTIQISVTLKDGGSWFILFLKTHEELIQILNTGMYQDNKLAAVMFDVCGKATIFDFVLKAQNVNPWRTVKS